MALNQEELHQLKSLLDEQTSSLNRKIEGLDKKIDERSGELHVRLSLDIKMALSPIEHSLHELNEQLSRLNRQETGDIGAAYEDIVDIKKRLAKLERRLAQLNK